MSKRAWRAPSGGIYPRRPSARGGWGGLVAPRRLQIWHVYVIALLLGVASAYDMPAYQAFSPELVDREDLPQAISLNQASFHGSRIIGPAAAGKLVALWGTSAAFFAN